MRLEPGPWAFGDFDRVALSFKERLPDWEVLWHGWWKRIRRWRRPPHWSLEEWRDEAFASAAQATWEALQTFDPRQGRTLKHFVQLHILRALVTGLRHEWSFARRRTRQRALEFAERARAASGPSAEDRQTLADLLAELSDERERFVVEAHYLEHKSEAEIGRQLGRSQSWVSKCKSKVLKKLQRAARKDGGGRKNFGIKRRAGCKYTW